MRHLLLLVAVASLLGGRTAPAQTFVPIDDRTWSWHPAEGGVTGLLVAGDREAVAVDIGATPADARRFLAEARKLTSRPIRHVVGTSVEPARVLGAALMPQRSFSFITSTKTRRALAEHAVHRAALAAHTDRRSVLEASVQTLPDRPIENDVLLDLGGRTVEVLLLEGTRDDTALAVWVPESRLLATGNVFDSEAVLDLEGAAVEDWLPALRELLERKPAKVAPGSGHVVPGDEFAAWVGHLEQLVDHSHDLQDADAADDRLIAPLAAMIPALTDGDEPALGAILGNLRAAADRRRARAPRPIESYPEEERPRLVPDGPPTPVETSDGRLRFTVMAEGTVSIHDLFNGVHLGDVAVDGTPGHGCLLPGDTDFAVPVRGARPHLAVINTATHAIARRVELVGAPASAVVTEDGRTIRIGDVEHRVVTELDAETLMRQPSAVGDAPAPAAAGESKKTTVTVLGMTHSRHRESAAWGLAQVREAIRRFRPDVVLTEIPPNRWRRIRADWFERGAIEDDRVKLFPEYVDVLLPLAVESGFTIEPCAAWTAEMARQRRDRTRALRGGAHAELDALAAAATQAAQRPGDEDLLASDDPIVIHGAAYDAAVRRRMAGALVLNDYIGAGGWDAINASHWSLIARQLTKHRGRRVLITFGAWHKYRFLEQLAEREDVDVVDPRRFLPEPENVDVNGDTCIAEVVELHRFFQSWFRGELVRDAANFARASTALGPEFTMVAPGGVEVERETVLARIEAAHGARATTSSITIENARAIELGPGRWMVRYEEWIEDGRGRRGIKSTAIFAPAPGAPRGVSWISLHETDISAR